MEVLLGDGARLVVLLNPLGRGAPAGAGGTVADADGPGAIVQAPDVEQRRGAAAALDRRTLEVRNTSRRVVRVSSHFPFDQVNSRLVFDREAARGFRLDLDAGSSERWAPGEKRTVTLVRLAGEER